MNSGHLLITSLWSFTMPFLHPSNFYLKDGHYFIFQKTFSLRLYKLRKSGKIFQGEFLLIIWRNRSLGFWHDDGQEAGNCKFFLSLSSHHTKWIKADKFCMRVFFGRVLWRIDVTFRILDWKNPNFYNNS
jgi:hypothetical protein